MPACKNLYMNFSFPSILPIYMRLMPSQHSKERITCAFFPPQGCGSKKMYTLYMPACKNPYMSFSFSVHLSCTCGLCLPSQHPMQSFSRALRELLMLFNPNLRFAHIRPPACSVCMRLMPFPASRCNHSRAHFKSSLALDHPSLRFAHVHSPVCSVCGALQRSRHHFLPPFVSSTDRGGARC